MKRGYLLALLAPALAFTAVAASGTAASPTAAGKSAAVVANPSCKSPTIGYAGPLTGPNASIGQHRHIAGELDRIAEALLAVEEYGATPDIDVAAP